MPIRHPVAFPTGHVVTAAEWFANHTLPTQAELGAILDPRYVEITGDIMTGDLQIGAVADRNKQLQVWGEAGKDVLDLQVSSAGVGTRLQVQEVNVVNWGRRMALLNFTDHLGGQYGALSGSLMVLDIAGAGSSSIVMSDPTGVNYSYISQTFATSLMDIANPFGDIQITAGGNDVYPAGLYNFGLAGNRWGTVFTEYLDISQRVIGDLVPFADDAQDVGSEVGPPFLWRNWRNAYIDGTAFIDTLQNRVAWDVSLIDVAGAGAGAFARAIPVTYSGGVGWVYIRNAP